MKRLSTAILLAAISLAPVFAADQTKSTTTQTKSHGKRHHRKNQTKPRTSQPAKK